MPCDTYRFSDRAQHDQRRDGTEPRNHCAPLLLMTAFHANACRSGTCRIPCGCHTACVRRGRRPRAGQRAQCIGWLHLASPHTIDRDARKGSVQALWKGERVTRSKGMRASTQESVRAALHEVGFEDGSRLQHCTPKGIIAETRCRLGARACGPNS